MKTFKKTSLPPFISYNKKKFQMDGFLSAKCHSQSAKRSLHSKLNGAKISHVFVEVLSKQLQGKLDFHNKPYSPNIFVFVDVTHHPTKSAACSRVLQLMDSEEDANYQDSLETVIKETGVSKMLLEWELDQYI